MNPERNRALYHALVLTDKKPENAFGFEARLDNQIRNSYGRSVFIRYQHNVGRRINRLSDCIQYVDEFFQNSIDENESFDVKSLDLDNVRTLVISWKNKARMRETFNFMQKPMNLPQ